MLQATYTHAGKTINNERYTHQILTVPIPGERVTGEIILAEHCTKQYSKYLLSIHFLNPHNGAWK